MSLIKQVKVIASFDIHATFARPSGMDFMLILSQAAPPDCTLSGLLG